MVNTMTNKKKPKTFEEAMARLEHITQTMQSHEMPLESALEAYQEGVDLIRLCQEKLAQAEQKLQILDENGLKDFHLETND